MKEERRIVRTDRRRDHLGDEDSVIAAGIDVGQATLHVSDRPLDQRSAGHAVVVWDVA